MAKRNPNLLLQTKQIRVKTHKTVCDVQAAVQQHGALDSAGEVVHQLAHLVRMCVYVCVCARCRCEI